MARQSGASTFDLVVVDENGRVIVRRRLRQHPLPAPIDTEIGAPIAQVFES